MSVEELDNKFILYSLAMTFRNNLGVSLSSSAVKFIEGEISEKFDNLDTDSKIYYFRYSLKMAESLLNYIPKITEFSMANFDDTVSPHNFIIESKKMGTKYIRLVNTDSFSEDIIPNKLMKICKYNKKTNVGKEYYSEYESTCEDIYDRISDEKKYSDLSDDEKEKYIFKPITNLVISTLSGKRKCAPHLYNHLLPFNDIIAIKAYKKKFIIYDFTMTSNLKGKTHEVTSLKLKKISSSQIEVEFSNGVLFDLNLKTNGKKISEHISLKYHAKIGNIDDTFLVESVIV